MKEIVSGDDPVPRESPTTRVDRPHRRRIDAWLPSMLVVSVIGAVVVWVSVTDPIESDLAPRAGIAAARGVADMSLAPEVVPWDLAVQRGTTDTVSWGPRCDRATGKLALPVLAGPCFAPYTGDNGGATAAGVTADSVRIVAYTANPDDASAQLISGAVPGAIRQGANFDTQERYVRLLSAYFERYGRTIDLIEFVGTGQISDPVSAVADAETIARDLTPFAVIGGPQLTNAFADTLAARRVLCIDCTPGQSSKFYADRAPYVWSVGMNPEQSGLLLNEFLAKQLAGRAAEHAGDPAMRSSQRVFGSVHISLGPDSAEIADVLADDLAARGVTVAAEVTFDSPLQVQATGRDMITQLKERGVTTVVYVGDPFTPITLTKIATEQGYFPEWVTSGLALIDTNTIPRFFDQGQWAHAFGLANLPVGRTDGANSAFDLYQWYYGEPPPQPGGSAALLFLPIVTLMNAIQLAGANLTVDAVRDALFQSPAVSGVGSISFGTRGIWDGPDHSGTDDSAIVWWDAEASGNDEIGRSGLGMWRYVQADRRYLPGGFPDEPVALFDRSTSVTGVEPTPLASYRPLRS